MNPLSPIKRHLCQLFWILFVAFCFAAHAAAPNVTPLGSLAQQLHGPSRIAADAAGNLYVTDPAVGRVVVFNAFGQPVAVHEGFAKPLAIAIAGDGQIYLSEEQNGSVSVFDPQWNLLYQLGAGTNEFQSPGNLAVDPSESNRVYVSDGAANLVRVFSGATQTSQFGGAGAGDGQFDFPAGICVRTNGEVFVLDQNNDRVQVFTNGVFARKISFSSGGMFGSAPSGRSQALLVDNAGRLFVAETMQGVVNVYDADTGAALGSIGGFGDRPGQLCMPAGMVLDGCNRLCVASANNSRIELFGLDNFLHLSATLRNSSLAAGNNLVFSVIPGGTNLPIFQWQKNGVNVVGATNGTLTIANATAGDSGTYSIIINGASVAITNVGTSATVVDPLKILAAPQNQTAMRGEGAVFSVTASGTSPTYQWQFNSINLDGATNPSLFLSNLQAEQSGQYTVLVSNSIGSVTSAAASLTVISPPNIVEIVDGTLQTNQQFQLTMNVDPGFIYALDTTTNLLDWQTIANFTDVAGLFDYVDADSTNYLNRFYRLRWAP